MAAGSRRRLAPAARKQTRRHRRFTRAVALVGVVAVGMLWASGAGAAVLTSTSGWFWGNPRPQGNDLHAIDFAGGRGYAAGEFGTLVRTDDAGATWTGVTTGVVTDLTRVEAIDADKVIAGGGCTLLRTDDGGERFTRLPFPGDGTCAVGLRSLSFPSSESGFLLLGDGTVQRTGDGGRTFSPAAPVPGTRAAAGTATAIDVFFTSASNGVATTSSPAGGRIYRTTDGGSSWVLAAAQATGLNDALFVDGSNGYAVGNDASVLATSDGGASWVEKPMAGAKRADGASHDLTSIACGSATACLMTTTGRASVVRTTDGGDTAQVVEPGSSPFDKYGKLVDAVGFASRARAIAVGDRGTTVASDNAGGNFVETSFRFERLHRPGHIAAIEFSRLRATSASVAHAAGDFGTVARTTDGGRSWRNIGPPTEVPIADISFPTARAGFAFAAFFVNTPGYLLRTDDGGRSWLTVREFGNSGHPRAILAVDRRTLLLFGPRGVRRSANGGRRFSPARGRGARAPLTDVDKAGRSVFAWGRRALIASTDRGRSWSPLRRPPGRSLAEVDFVRSRTGFALTGDGRLWRTADRGRRWRELPATGANAIDLAFASAREGYLTIRSFDVCCRGYRLHTSDGGRTWRMQVVGPEPGLHRGLVASGGTAFTLAARGQLFATTTGGDVGAPSALSLRTARKRLSRTQAAKPVTVSGRMTPAEGGEQVVVSMRSAGSPYWDKRVVQAAADGTFSTTWDVRRTSLFVAQWTGDDDRRGAGSPVLRVSAR